MRFDTPVGGAPRLGLGPEFCEWVMAGPLKGSTVENVCYQLGFSSQHWRKLRAGIKPAMVERIAQLVGILQREHGYPPVLIVLDPATMRPWIQPLLPDQDTRA